MNVEYLIQVLENKLTVLNNARNQAFSIGDLERILAIETEVLDVQNTLSKLRLLIGISLTAAATATTETQVVSNGVEATFAAVSPTPDVIPATTAAPVTPETTTSSTPPVATPPEPEAATPPAPTPTPTPIPATESTSTPTSAPAAPILESVITPPIADTNTTTPVITTPESSILDFIDSTTTPVSNVTTTSTIDSVLIDPSPILIDPTIVETATPPVEEVATLLDTTTTSLPEAP